MVLILGDSFLFCCLDVDTAVTATVMLEVIFISCCYMACEPMGIGAAMVHADWLALKLMWVAPTGI
jgi:hypothetical protein